MAKNRQSITMYHDLKNAIGEYNQLEISVAYSLGGYNYWNGNHEARGLRVHFKPVKVTPHSSGINMVSFTCCGTDIRTNGFKSFVTELPRFSAKKLEALATQVKGNADRIVALYDEGRYHEIDSLVKSLKAA